VQRTRLAADEMMTHSLKNKSSNKKMKPSENRHFCHQRIRFKSLLEPLQRLQLKNPFDGGLERPYQTRIWQLKDLLTPLLSKALWSRKKLLH
jgi:hypothetical protein